MFRKIKVFLISFFVFFIVFSGSFVKAKENTEDDLNSFDLKATSVEWNNNGLVLSIINNGRSIFNGQFIISIFDLDGNSYIDYQQFNGQLIPNRLKKIVISTFYGSSNHYPNLELKLDYANTVTETNENNNSIIYHYGDADISSEWKRVETELNVASNFENGHQPEFTMSNGEFNYNGGQVLNASNYRGYEYKNVSLDGDFKLSFKVRSDSGFTDSNLVYFCLSTKKEGVYIKKDGGLRDNDSFCFYDSSGRSFYRSLYGPGSGGPGFAHLAIKYFNEARKNYSDIYNEVSEYNTYAYKNETNKEYQIVMQRKDGIVSASIYDADGELVYHWKINKENRVRFKYLSLVIGNNDDGDNYGSSGPIGKIWNINLTKVVNQVDELSTDLETDNSVETGLIYKSLSALLGKEDLVYAGNQIKPIKINTLEELKKYAQKVESHSGIIKIGSRINKINKSKKKIIKTREGIINKNNIEFIKKIGSPTVYKLNKKTRTLKKIINEKAYKRALDIPVSAPVDWSVVKAVSDSEFNSYRNYHQGKISAQGAPVASQIKNLYDQGSRLVKAHDKSTVYFITKDLKKRPILNAKVFKKLGFKWSDIKEVDNSYLATVVRDKSIKNIRDLKINKLNLVD